MIRYVVRFSLLGLALMAFVSAGALAYRYFFITPDLSISSRVVAMALVGALATGVGLAVLRTR